MALRYPPDFLLHLRESPLCTRPANLPPAEEWMGAPPDQIRSQSKTNARPNDNPLLDQTNRRPLIERHVSRNSANPEDIVFAPPRMAFASARGGNKSLENEKGLKDPETPNRFGNFRSRNGDADAERFREGKTSASNTTFRRRDGDQETEGWSMVKPRKSFGHEGAERFHGKMGGGFRDDRRQPKDRDDPAVARDRPARPFDTFSRDKDADDSDGRARNGLNRNKPEGWHKTEGSEGAIVPEKRERIDRAKSWRERDPNMEAFDDRTPDRNNGRTNDRRWGRGDRDHRVERDPEWLDEPLEEQPEAHTQQDFQKWMEHMKNKSATPSAPNRVAAEAVEAIIHAEKPPVQSAPAVETGPDKFFMNFAPDAGIEPATPGGEPKDGGSARARPAGKSSRFTSFFNNPQEDTRGRTEPATPMGGVPLMNATPGSSQPSAGISGHIAPQEVDRQAFNQLIAKLQKQSMSATPPGASPFSLPPQGTPSDVGKKSALTSPEPFQQYGGERRDGPVGRPPQHVQEILAPRPQQYTARPEQLLQDLVGHHQRVSSQGSMRPDAARNNSNTEFLMNLMRPGPAVAPDHQRNELLMRMQQPQKQVPMPQEPDFPRDNRGHQQQHRQMRPHPPPGFPLEEPFHVADHDGRPNQPTQILQRPPPPPGLDHIAPNWMPGAQLPPPQQRGPMLPPPGLAGGLGGGPNRNVPLPVFPPNFPPGVMPPPEALGGLPPRNIHPPPPPGFFAGPHGFLPPGLGGFNGPPGPDFAASPFEGRGPPPGTAGRGANFGRL